MAANTHKCAFSCRFSQALSLFLIKSPRKMFFIEQLMNRKNLSNSEFETDCIPKLLVESIPRKRKKSSALFFTIGLVALLFFNFVNLQVLDTLRITFPLVDVVQFLLSETKQEGANVDALIVDTLKDVYSRRESFYLANIKSATVVVEPIFRISRKYISLTLKEGYLHKLEKNYAAIFPHIEIHTSIQELSKHMLSEGQSFIRKYLLPVINTIEYREVTDVPKRMKRLQLGNTLTLIFSLLLCIAIATKECVGSERVRSESCALVSVVLFAFILVLVTFFNVSVSILVDYRFPNSRSHLIVVLYAMQLFLTLALFIYYIRGIKRDAMQYISERSIRRKCKDFEPSAKSETSSIYLPSPENDKYVGIPVEKNSYSSKPGSSMRQASIFASSPLQLNDISEKSTLDPLNQDGANQNRNPNPESAARVRKFTKSGIFQENPPSPVGLRSFSAPVIQLLATGSTGLSAAESIKNIQPTNEVEKATESADFIDLNELEPCKSN